MDLRVFGIDDKKFLVPSSYDAFLAEFADRMSYFLLDIAQPESAPLEGLFSMLDLHPLVLESCLDTTTSARVMPFPHCLYVQLPLQTLERIALAVVCMPRAMITVHDQPVPALDNRVRGLRRLTAFPCPEHPGYPLSGPGPGVR